jgi:hypothetical protein
MCVRNLGRLEQPGGCKCNATARGIEQSGRASRSATPPTRGRHLAAAPSGPGTKTAAGNVLYPITIGNKNSRSTRLGLGRVDFSPENTV